MEQTQCVQAPSGADFDAVVIGSGAFGASTTYHLAARYGWSVALVDRHAIASQTSPRAAGLTRRNARDDTMAALLGRSIEKILCFADETGQPLDYHQVGSVNIARTAADATRLHQEIETGLARGLDIAEVDAADLARLAPWLRPDPVLATWYTASDVYLEPGPLPLGYARAAEQHGAALMPHTEVIGVETGNGAVRGVRTSAGPLHAPVVIDAAGAWSRMLVEAAGGWIPMTPVRHQLVVTEPIAEVRPEHAICRVMDARVYVRPDRGGLMLGGYEPEPSVIEMRSLPPSFDIADLELDGGVLTHLASRVADVFPVFQTAAIRELRGGLPTMTIDGLPLVGPLPGLAGFFVATGCCVGGLSVSPGVGESLAALIAGGSPRVPLGALAIDRFEERWDEERLRAACVRAYGRAYATVPDWNA